MITTNDLIRDLVTRIDRRVDELQREGSDSPDFVNSVRRMAHERCVASPRAFLIGLEVTLLLDIVDERLPLSNSEKLDVWCMIEAMAARHREKWAKPS